MCTGGLIEVDRVTTENDGCNGYQLQYDVARLRVAVCGSKSHRGVMVASSSGQGDAGVSDGLEPCSHSPDRTRHPCLKAVGVDSKPRLGSGYSGLCSSRIYCCRHIYDIVCMG